jgi:hypothetical protein
MNKIRKAKCIISKIQTRTVKTRTHRSNIVKDKKTRNSKNQNKHLKDKKTRKEQN